MCVYIYIYIYEYLHMHSTKDILYTALVHTINHAGYPINQSIYIYIHILY